MTDLQSGAQPDEQWRIVEPLTLTPLLTAALEVFHELGYHGASVRDIAKRAGVTVPTLYYHHGNKQGILVALMEPGIENVTARASAAVDAAGPSPTAQFGNLVEACVLHMTSRSDIAFLDSELRYLEDAERKSYAAKRKKLENLLVDVLTAGVDSGEFTVPDITGTGPRTAGHVSVRRPLVSTRRTADSARSQCSLP
ncbi:transcriptional regulator, TetR family' [Rhodococcus erythropolis]|uniref:Transcriptional regulator, TetR family n=1 Tax=Rhodococcus erythropolis TaxID=1833 RepID=A0A6G9CQW2_RHOER|nr:transcriptional regulator, TetR family' [Rhodococcus erythropolis]